jgi:hypothetical protein
LPKLWLLVVVQDLELAVLEEFLHREAIRVDLLADLLVLGKEGRQRFRNMSPNIGKSVFLFQLLHRERCDVVLDANVVFVQFRVCISFREFEQEQSAVDGQSADHLFYRLANRSLFDKVVLLLVVKQGLGSNEVGKHWDLADHIKELLL